MPVRSWLVRSLAALIVQHLPLQVCEPLLRFAKPRFCGGNLPLGDCQALLLSVGGQGGCRQVLLAAPEEASLNILGALLGVAGVLCELGLELGDRR